MKKLITLSLAIILVGCQTFYSSVVTVTEVRKAVLNELGVMYRAGLISDETDAKIQFHDDQFKIAARSMELALTAYKAGNSDIDPATKLQEVKAPIKALIDILTPLAGELIVNKHKNNLEKATQL